MNYEPIKADGFYHIYNRGNNREDIFIEERNYQYFLKLIESHITPVCKIYSYCLLKNHFHLLIQTKDNIEDKIISRAFSNFFNAYSKAINKAYQRRGSLFQDRFKRIEIKDENYLQTLILYIHLNPLNHGMVNDFTNYKHSSFSYLASEKKSFLMAEEIYKLFGDRENFIISHHQRQEEILEIKDAIFFDN